MNMSAMRDLFTDIFLFDKAENVTLIKKKYFSFQKLKKDIGNTFLKKKKIKNEN